MSFVENRIEQAKRNGLVSMQKEIDDLKKENDSLHMKLFHLTRYTKVSFGFALLLGFIIGLVSK